QPEKTELSEQPETQDLIALMDVLVSPAHDLSLARALKSPIFLAPDDALVELAERARQQQGPSRYWLDLLQQETWAAPALTAAAERMGRWKRWVDRMPPHDALDAIFHDGDVLARYAQAAPPALREGVLANLRALLGAALQVAGGRFLTPYAFVRAMRAGGVRAPAMSDANAVRLLTVHGAKGLEAPLVLMLDTDGEAARAESMGVIVDWPGEAAAPRRFAFLASESRAPACCLETLEAERHARQREELNGLYVAMTRARRELAVSSMVPRSGSPGSWWQRLLPVCEPVAPEALETAAAQLQPARETLWLPVAPALPEAARIAPAAAASASLRPTPDTDESRFGQALHRLLEHWPAAADTPPATLKRRVQREFALDAPTLDAAAAMACAIRWGEGAWSWDAAHIDWAGNEVELRHKGEALRLDRLVRERATGAWWVLDYKSAARPQQDAALIAQLRRYRDAVALANPGATVQAAFLTGQGRLAPLA
ncbi:MAG TPA: 3'-5' exonuclease, partial [Ramlibacter sp.]|nr:3'-5' exonuclease [Ramlibacter sp.]